MPVLQAAELRVVGLEPPEGFASTAPLALGLPEAEDVAAATDKAERLAGKLEGGFRAAFGAFGIKAAAAKD